MTLADQNIETLQTEVDQVKRDLDVLKKETNETTKKNKAETLEKGLSSTKEKINKKIDELKKLGEETYKADIVKLEAMLITLETSTSALDTLRTDVITKSGEISKSMNETVDTTPDFEKISAGMQELTTMATDLQTVIDDFKKNKETMTDAEKTEKQKEIQEKRLAMEAKRQEIQQLINNVKKNLKESTFDDIDDEEVRNNLTIQKAVEEKKIADYQKQLDMIDTPASTGLEKAKNAVNKTWGWVKRNPLATGGIVLGAGLLIGWMAGLFKRKKKNETNTPNGGTPSTTEEKEKKGFWQTGFGKLVKLGLIGTGAYFLFKGFSTGKRPWSHKEGTGSDVGDTMSSTENAAESFDKLIKDSPEKAEKLNKIGNNVNEFYDKIYSFNDGSLPEGMTDARLGKGEEKYAGAIPHILENSFSSIDDMETQRGLFMICVYEDLNAIKKAFAELIGKGAQKLVSGVLGIFGSTGIVDQNNVEDKVTEFIGGKNKIDQVHMVFRKILKVMAYTNYVENVFLGKEIEKNLKEGKLISKQNENDMYETIHVDANDPQKMKELVNHMQTYPGEYKIGENLVSDIRDGFRDQELNTIFDYNIETKEILSYNPDIEEIRVDINNKRDEAIKNLEKNKEKTLDDLKNNAEEEISNGMRENIKKRIPLLHMTEGINDDSVVKKNIKEDAGFKKMLQNFYEKFDQLKGEKDMTIVKKKIDDYFATIKELSIAENSIGEMVDENGDIVTTFISAAKSTFDDTVYCFTHGTKLIMEGEYVSGITLIYGGVVTGAGIGMVLFPKSILTKLLVKGATIPPKIVWRGVQLLFPQRLAMAHISNILPASYLASSVYKSPELLTQGIARGMSVKKAWNVFQKIEGMSGQQSQIFIQRVLGIADPIKAAKIESIIFEGGSEITSTGRQFLTEIIERPGALSSVKNFNITGLDAAITKFEQLKNIQGVATATEGLGDVVVVANQYSHLLQQGDDVTSLTQKILNAWNDADKLKNINHFDDVVQVGKAKAYAEKILEMKEGGAVVETGVESSSQIGQAWNKAKEMFSEGTQKIKQLFQKNPTVSSEMNAGLEKGIAETEKEVANITAKEVEVAKANPGSAEAQNVANTINKNLPFRKRLLKFSPFLVDAIFNIFDGVGMTKEAAEIAKVNQERAGVKSEQANLSFTVAGIEVVLFTLGMANARNPAGRAILAVTAGIEVVKFGSRKYYEVVDSYYRNFEDFKRMYVAKIKQEIISKESWSESIDISFQEKFQQIVSWIFGSTLHGEKKMVRTNVTVDEALRGLIRLEESENYPYAMVNLEHFKSKEYEELQKVVNEQNDALTTDVRDRFSYIKTKYGNQLLSKDNIEHAKGKENIDNVLKESRKYLSMKKNQGGENISEYQQHMIDDLNQNPNFERLEKLYTTSPLQIHKIMKSYPYFTLFIQQTSSSYQNIDVIKQNMDYMVKYYQYKTFGLLPSDIPPIEINENSVDYGLMEKFFTNFEIHPSGLTKQQLIQGFQDGQIEMYSSYTINEKFGISSNIGQNVLYRIAKEVLGGYKGKNDLDDLKLFYTAENRETTGLYYEDGMRWANVHGGEDRMMGPDIVLNKVKRVEMLGGMIKGGSMLNSMIDTDTETAEKYINKEYGEMMLNIIKQEMVYRLPKNIEKYKKTAYEYIKANASGGKYIPLPLDMVNRLTRAGVENVGYYYYTRTDSGVVALEGATGTIPAFLKKQIVHCGLTDKVEEYQIKEVPLRNEVKAYIESVDGMIHKINEVIHIDDEDMDITPDIRGLIARKVTVWKEYSIGLRHMNQDIALSSIQAKYPQFFMSFENIYMALLNCSSDGRDNDVDTYTDYLTINSSSRGSLIDFVSEAGSVRPSISINGFEYPDTYSTYVNAYIVPGKNKTTTDLLNSANPEELAYGKFAANVIMKAVLEAGMVEFNENDEVTALYNATNRRVNTTTLEKRLTWYFTTTPNFVSEMYT